MANDNIHDSKLFISAAKIAIEGDLFDKNQRKRTSAYGKFIIQNLSLHESKGRSYVALDLPSIFYGNLMIKQQVPHLEISERFLSQENHLSFINYLSQAGNGLFNNVWVYPEIKALKKSLFVIPSDETTEFIEEINNISSELVVKINIIKEKLKNNWALFESYIHSEKAMSIVGVFTSEEIHMKIPKINKNVSFEFNDYLLNNSEKPFMNVGIWGLKLFGQNLTVITPRLTYGSLFNDKLFLSEKEGSLSLLIQFLVYERVSREIFKVGYNILPRPVGFFYQGTQIKGKQLPRPSKSMVANLLITYKNGQECWDKISEFLHRYEKSTTDMDIFIDTFNKQKELLNKHDSLSDEYNDILFPIVVDKNLDICRVLFKLKNEE